MLVAAAALLAVVAFLLLGSSGAQLSSPIAQAASFSSSASGFRMRMSIQMSSPQLPTPITAGATGVADLRDRAFDISFAMNFGSDPQLIQLLGSSTMRMRMLLAGGVLYLKFPSALSARLPMSGKAWLSFDISQLKGVPGLSSLGSSPTMQDPTHILQVLESESTNVVNEGKQTVNGIETTHYRASLDLTHIAASLPPSQRAAIEREISAYEQAAKSEVIPVDVWIDPVGYIRRMVMAIDLSLPNGGSMIETVSADFSDYGPQPPPVAPPSSDVQDISSLIHVQG